VNPRPYVTIRTRRQANAHNVLERPQDEGSIFFINSEQVSDLIHDDLISVDNRT